MKLNIDLSTKPDQGLKPLNSDPVSYPEVTFRTGEDLELPKMGRLVIDFEVTHESENEHKGRKPEYSCTICVKKLVSVNKKESAKEEAEEDVEAPVKKSTTSDTEESLDSIAKAQGYK